LAFLQKSLEDSTIPRRKLIRLGRENLKEPEYIEPDTKSSSKTDYFIPTKELLAFTISEIAERTTGETFDSDFEVRNCGA